MKGLEMPFFGKKSVDKAEKKDDIKEGKAAEMLATSDAPPAADPRLQLNARQLFKLKTNWKGIKRNMEPAATEMFVR